MEIRTEGEGSANARIFAKAIHRCDLLKNLPDFLSTGNSVGLVNSAT